MDEDQRTANSARVLYCQVCQAEFLAGVMFARLLYYVVVKNLDFLCIPIIIDQFCLVPKAAICSASTALWPGYGPLR